ncbi:MAG: putative ABC transporter permease [Campylobacteraceae bacterium]
MHSEYLVHLAAFWIIYSFFGWIIETVYCRVLDGHFTKRGFLIGPFVPIYGFGALIILLCLDKYIQNLFLVFILGLILTSTLEYITSYFMEMFLKLKLWDYSGHFMNINGRVCLLNSTLFGLLCVLLVGFIQPHVKEFVESINFGLLSAIVMIFVLTMGTDFFYSILGALALKNRLLDLDALDKKIKAYSQNEKEKREKSL